MLERIQSRFHRHVAPHIRDLGIPATQNDIRLLSLRGRHKGKRCFIVGNGPSLRTQDLELLYSHKEYSLASNKIFLLFDQTEWRPSYYGIEDTGVAKAESEIISKLQAESLFVADYLKPIIQNERAINFMLRARATPPQLPHFATNLLSGVYCGGTITYTLMQFAHWLGFSEIILVGVDFSYHLAGLKNSDLWKGLKTYTPHEGNYFSKNYIKPGEAVVAPDLESSLCAYKSALSFSRRNNFRIRNATRGGKLEIFDRVDFDSLFK